MMSMGSVRGIGIIGAGSYGAAHAEAIRELSTARLVAASRTNEAELRSFCTQYEAAGYTDYRELLARPDIDTVVIATPHHLHTSIALAAAAARKHILLEKPMAPTLAECDQIIAAVRQAGVGLMVGHVNHFVPAYQRARALLDSGEMGEIVMGVSTMSKFWFEPNRRWWHLDRGTGGGMWMTAGIHPLDRLTWLIGSQVTAVSARLRTRFHDQPADDVGMVFLRYANGAMGTVVSTGYADGAPKHLTELTCTNGMINIDYTAGVTVGKGERWQTLPDTGHERWMHAALVEEWRQFLDSLDRGTPSPVTGEFARHIMSVVLAAEESSARDAEVRLDPQL